MPSRGVVSSGSLTANTAVTGTAALLQDVLIVAGTAGTTVTLRDGGLTGPIRLKVVVAGGVTAGLETRAIDFSKGLIFSTSLFAEIVTTGGEVFLLYELA